MEYYNTLNDLYTSNNQLVHNFQESIFPASIFNLGPNTVTLDHIDYANVAYGLCGISALGKYNPDKGGHMILFDLGVMICFPPRSTILIPSSVLRHLAAIDPAYFDELDEITLGPRKKRPLVCKSSYQNNILTFFKIERTTLLRSG
jgi:hypothetical protein